MAKTKKAWKIAAAAGLTVMLIIAGLLAWFSFGKLTLAKLTALKILPYPLALVNGQPIFIQTYLKNLHWAEIYNQKQNMPLNSADLQQTVVNQVLREEKTKQLAARLNIAVSQRQLNEEYYYFQKNFNQRNPATLVQSLTEYGFSQQQFQTEILEPEILLDNLAIWYNQQRDLNQASYQTSDQIQQELAAGKSFDSLAKEYTQDQNGKLLDGDLGFIESTDLLPELKPQIEQMNVGEVKFLASRFGLHLIKLEEKASSPQAGSSRLHLRQIFIQPTNFELWYQAQLNNFPVKMLVKI